MVEIDYGSFYVEFFVLLMFCEVLKKVLSLFEDFKDVVLRVVR